MGAPKIADKINEVIQLFKQGYAESEIAKMYGVSVNTVYTAIRRYRLNIDPSLEKRKAGRIPKPKSEKREKAAKPVDLSKQQRIESLKNKLERLDSLDIDQADELRNDLGLSVIYKGSRINQKIPLSTPEKAIILSMYGYTNKEIASVFNVSTERVRLWNNGLGLKFPFFELRRDRIIELAKAGKSYKEISAETGASYYSVGCILSRSGAVRQHNKYDQIAGVVEDFFNKGLTPYRISKEIGVGYNTVMNSLFYLGLLGKSGKHELPATDLRYVLVYKINEEYHNKRKVPLKKLAEAQFAPGVVNPLDLKFSTYLRLLRRCYIALTGKDKWWFIDRAKKVGEVEMIEALADSTTGGELARRTYISKDRINDAMESMGIKPLDKFKPNGFPGLDPSEAREAYEYLNRKPAQDNKTAKEIAEELVKKEQQAKPQPKARQWQDGKTPKEVTEAIIKMRQNQKGGQSMANSTKPAEQKDEKPFILKDKPNFHYPNTDLLYPPIECKDDTEERHAKWQEKYGDVKSTNIEEEFMPVLWSCLEAHDKAKTLERWPQEVRKDEEFAPAVVEPEQGDEDIDEWFRKELEKVFGPPKNSYLDDDEPLPF